MPTVKELLDNGYKFSDENSMIPLIFQRIDYDAVIDVDDRFFCDKEKKIILCIPITPDVTVETIELQYLFGKDILIAKMLYSDEHFQFTYNDEEVKNVLEELVFEYSTFAYDIKEKNPSLGRFSGVTMIVTGNNLAGDRLEIRAYYLPSSIEDSSPEIYSGTETYINGILCLMGNNLLLYNIYSIQGLKDRIKSFVGASN